MHVPRRYNGVLANHGTARLRCHRHSFVQPPRLPPLSEVYLACRCSEGQEEAQWVDADTGEAVHECIEGQCLEDRDCRLGRSHRVQLLLLHNYQYFRRSDYSCKNYKCVYSSCDLTAEVPNGQLLAMDEGGDRGYLVGANKRLIP